MPGGLLVPRYDDGKGNPVLIDPGKIQVPVKTLQGGVDTTDFGNLFPEDSEPFWLDPDDIPDINPRPDSVMPDDPSLLRGWAEDYAKAEYVTQEGKYGEIPVGAYVEWIIYQKQRESNEPSPPFGPCKFHATFQWITYKYFCQSRPIFSCANDTPFPCDVFGNFAPHEIIDFGGCVATYIGPDYLGKWHCGSGNTATNQFSLNADGSDPQEYTPMSPPDPVSFPSGVPLPVYGSTASPPTITGGTVTQASPGMGGSITFTRNSDGSLTPNIALPDCTCKDGVTPTFDIGVVSTVKSLGVTVKIRSDSPNHYLLDFNIPDMSFDWESFTTTLAVWDEETETEKPLETEMWFIKDDDHSTKSAFLAMLMLLVQIRACLPDSTHPVSPVPPSI